ncbi:MAG: hypothetical protein DI629_14930 [Mesorhizobium amorphae]|nr:MAG: hypothetical protein DI629_14930 [Mesorhizobium amorphae]
MADFVAVLKKTLGGMGEPSPQMRTRVYDKARATIEAKLAALNPPAPEAVAQRQRQALEDAIASVERDYAPPPAAAPAPKAPEPKPDPLAELDNVFSSINRQRQTPLAPSRATSTPPAPKPAEPAPAAVAPQAPKPASAPVSPPKPASERVAPPAPPVQPVRPASERVATPLPPVTPVRAEPAPVPSPPPRPAAPAPSFSAQRPVPPPPVAQPAPSVSSAKVEDKDDTFPDHIFDDREREPETAEDERDVFASTDFAAHDAARDEFSDDWRGEALPPQEEERVRRNRTGLAIAAVAILAVGGGAIAAWQGYNPFAGDTTAVTETETPSTDIAAQAPPAETPAVETATPETAEEEGEEAAAATPPAEPEQEVAAVAPEAEVTDPAPAAPAASTKFTQRLTADGQEIDEGAGTGAGALGEGTSVAAVSPSQPATPPGSAPATTAQAPATSAPAQGNAALPVAQRAIFYEERTNVAQSSAETGTILWSNVTESPGGDMAAEPAVRAEAAIPAKNVQLRMTIRRNGDRTLPASHIIELIFLTPEGFEGGGIENVLRVSMKNSEQETGAALRGIPAKIAEGYFLIALSDNPADIQANLALLRQQSWIDVPVVYKSGRRALITMEKGIPGEQAFNEALRAWGGNSG